MLLHRLQGKPVASESPHTSLFGRNPLGNLDLLGTCLLGDFLEGSPLNLVPKALHQVQKSLLLHETSHVPNTSHLPRRSWTGESLRPAPSLQAQCPVFSLGQLGFHLRHCPLLLAVPHGLRFIVSKAIFLKCRSLHGLPLSVWLPGKLDSRPPSTAQSLPQSGPRDPYTPTFQGNPQRGQSLTPLCLCTPNSLLFEYPSALFTGKTSFHPSRPSPITPPGHSQLREPLPSGSLLSLLFCALICLSLLRLILVLCCLKLSVIVSWNQCVLGKDHYL